ncbi:MAG: TA0938 family protein [Thermoplasmata archaeon]
MKVPEAACALCDSEWGDHWEEVDGHRMFFCCWVCARAFDNVVQEVKRRTGWEALDQIQIEGDYRGRQCAALRGAEAYRFRLRFDPETGELLVFEPIASV